MREIILTLFHFESTTIKDYSDTESEAIESVDVMSLLHGNDIQKIEHFKMHIEPGTDYMNVLKSNPEKEMVGVDVYPIQLAYVIC